MTDRRNRLGGMAALLAAKGILAQTSRPTRKLGYLHPSTIAHTHPTLAVLRGHWQKLGDVDGETALLRSADNDLSRIPALLNEMAAQGVSAVIVVVGAAVRAASRATKTLPIFAIDLETDPANMPVQQPTTVELVVKFPTVGLLGITVPRSLLHRAERVIE